MTNIEARQIAQQYALGMSEILPGLRHGIGEEEDFTGKYYFDFILLHMDVLPPEEPPMIAGARGLTVDKKNGQVEVMSFGSYHSLKSREEELAEICQLLLDVKNNKLNLTAIKTKLNLNSKQLVALSRAIKEADFHKDSTFELMSDLLDKIRTNL